jgi:hypothetical protein
LPKQNDSKITDYRFEDYPIFESSNLKIFESNLIGGNMSKNKYLLILVLLGLISFAGATTFIVPSVDYPTIQSAINAASLHGDKIQVAAGTYPEDLIIDHKANLELVGASGAIIVEQATYPFPIGIANIKIWNSNGVKIHGFTIKSPALEAGHYSPGIVIDSKNVQIYNNTFEVARSSDYSIGVSVGIQTSNKEDLNVPQPVDVSGLYIHDNTFTDLGSGDVGYDAIYINPDTGTGTVAIVNNQFTDYIWRGITTERSHTTISGNSLITTAPDISDISYPLGIYIRNIKGENQNMVTLNGNTVKQFDRGIVIGTIAGTVIPIETLTNISVTQNIVQTNLIGVVVNNNHINGNITFGAQNTDPADPVNILNAENNWWGDASGPTPPSIPSDVGDVVSDNVDFDPWLTTATTAWNISAPMPTLIPPKYVKDGGAVVAVTSPTDEDNVIYAFKGWKSKEFKMFNGTTWIDKAEIPFALKPGTTTESKKYPNKGASLCWDGDNTIYATKGGNTFEFWAYDIVANTWARKKTIATPKGLKGGTSICWYGEGQDGKVYLLAGGQKNDEPNNFYAYTPGGDSGTWTAPGDLAGAPRQFPDTTIRDKAWKDGSCIVAMGSGENGVIYALKGGDKYNFLCAYDVGNTITPHSWATKETIPRVHPMLGKKTKTGDGGAMTTDGSFLYAIKGGGKQDFWMFTPGTPGVWAPLETIPRMGSGYGFRKSVPKTGAGLAYLNDYVYLLKGNKLDEFWRYNTGSITIARVNPSTITTTTSETTTKLNLNLTVNSFTRTINYTIQTAGKVSLKLYNATGRLVKTVYDGYINAGTYTTTLSNVNSGIYFLRYEDKTNQAEIKLIVQ